MSTEAPSSLYLIGTFWIFVSEYTRKMEQRQKMDPSDHPKDNEIA